MVVNISDKKFKTIVKESVREVLRSEIMKLRALLVPEVSEKEQKNIEKRYSAPSKKAVKGYTLKI